MKKMADLVTVIFNASNFRTKLFLRKPLFNFAVFSALQPLIPLVGRLDSVEWNGGQERWTGVDWNGGMEWWNGMVNCTCP